MADILFAGYLAAVVSGILAWNLMWGALIILPLIGKRDPA